MTYIPEASLPPVSWRDQAACRQPGLDADTVFFPKAPGGGRPRNDGRPPRDERWDTARDICAWCPPHVVEACLTESLDLGDFEGMRGGLTPDERRALAKVQR
jgi:hypothetical protein